MRSLMRIFSILPQKEYVNCVIIFLSMLVGAAVEALGIGLILPIISLIGNPDYLHQYPQVLKWITAGGEVSHKTLVIGMTSVLLIVYILKNLYLAWSIYFQICFSIRNQIHFSKGLLKIYLHKPYSFFINQNTAALIRNMTVGAEIVFSSMLIPAFQLMTEILTVVAIWFMLAFVDVFTAVSVVMVLALIMGAIFKIFRRKIAEQGIIVNQYTVQSIKWINQAFGAVKETKLMHKEDFFADSYDVAYRKTSRAQGEFNFINQLPRMIIEAVVVSALLVLIIVKSFLGDAMEDIVPLLSVLALAAFRLMPSANRIISYANSIKLQMPFFNTLYPDFLQIRDLINNPKSYKEQHLTNNKDKMDFKQIIKIRKLAFSYPNVADDVLQDVSFDIPRGAFVGIVGSSGAGKTTFVDVFLGLLSPKQGNIFIDGTDISTNVQAWQELLSYVPQDIYLIDGTILENIALGVAPEIISEERINKILQMVDLYEFISELPKGIHTNVGERGIKLSGGQKQRIGLARALYQDPKVLVLDEATSALDNETEKKIMETILKLKGKITILSIAHRVSTLAECDFKVELVDGKAVVHSGEI